ncbi:MAG: YceI family protein [Halieaceae bacterium]|nr:YceI family protein [Halieaceae bacterium]
MLKRSIMAAALIFSSAGSWADWQLDESQSTLTFLSDKNAGVVEQHAFEVFDVFVSDAGEIRAEIELASVETRIGIRNERMRDMLFQVAEFQKATLSGSLGELNLASVGAAPQMVSIPLTLSLHGFAQTLVADAWLSQADGALYVSTVNPILVRAADFGLAEGVEALRAVAGLKTIGQTVPVSFNLRLTSAQ